jgi:hypothetical protein
MVDDPIWLTLSPADGYPAVEILESGTVRVRDDLDADDFRQVLDLLSGVLRARLSEERRMRAELKRLKGED